MTLRIFSNLNEFMILCFLPHFRHKVTNQLLSVSTVSVSKQNFGKQCSLWGGGYDYKVRQAKYTEKRGE